MEKITLTFTEDAFRELKGEFNIRATMGDLNVSMSIADRILAVIGTGRSEDGQIMSSKEIQEREKNS